MKLYRTEFVYNYHPDDRKVIIKAACVDVTPYDATELRFSFHSFEDDSPIEVSFNEEEFNEIEEIAIEHLNDEKEEQVYNEDGEMLFNSNRLVN